MKSFFAAVLLMSSILASGQYVTNGACCDLSSAYYSGPICYALGEYDEDFDGVVSDLDCADATPFGCTDSTACNYNIEAIADDGSCTFVCPGCTVPSACNFDPSANSYDGSCIYMDAGTCDCDGSVANECGICGGPALPAYYLSVEQVATHIGDFLDGMTTYRLYLNCQNPTDYLAACFGNSEGPLILNSTSGSWYNNPANTTWNASGIIPVFFEFFPELAFDSFLTIGAENSTTPGAQHPSTLWGDIDASLQFSGSGAGTNVTVDDVAGGAWWSTFPGLQEADSHVGFAGEDLKILVAQITTEGSITGQFQVQVFIEGNQSLEFRETLSFPYCQGLYYNPGCTNPEACNYSPLAIQDDGTCLFFDECGVCDGPGPIYECGCNELPSAECDCNGSTIDALGICGGDCPADFDQDGLCDDADDCVGDLDLCGICNGPGAIFECGCTDIPIGECDCNGNQIDAIGVCGGSCIEDANGDGICDDCLDSIVDECGICGGAGIPEGQCDCDGNVLDECGVCGGAGIPEGQCDCNGNVLDACGVCGGTGIPEGQCDCDGNVLDECGVCGGEGIPTGDCDCDGNVLDECGVCGGDGIPAGQCDCQGSTLDAIGVCGGDCTSDLNNNGICDLEELAYGCGPANCGQGTIWDEATQKCIPDNPSDLNFDGCVDVQDFMGHLAAFGSGCEEEIVETPWECGDPLTYQGYDYTTVLIGEQCWFAENLRNENYNNGDAIPAGLNDIEWTSNSSGATAVFGEGISNCYEYSPDGDACDEDWSLNVYGRLYNWYAVNDARGLCPSGWHVPTDGEWTVMTNHLGGESIAGGQMKTDYGWDNDGNGTNSSGFSGLPGGYRGHDDGYFDIAGQYAVWWSSSPNASFAWASFLDFSNENVNHSFYIPKMGFSVRCIQDAE